MKRKYRIGRTISSLSLLASELEERRWVFYKGKPLHPNFILNMTFATVLGGLHSGIFAVAKENELV